MTTIVGIQGAGWSLVAADSLTVYGTQPFSSASMRKVNESGPYVVAMAGDAIACDLATYLWRPRKPSASVPLESFMMTRVMPSLRAAFLAHGYEASPGGAKNDTGFEGLISVNGTLFQINNDFGIMRDDRRLYAIGTGGAYALGALAVLGADRMTPERAVKAVRKAMWAATEYDVNTGGNVSVVIQRSRNVR